MDQISSLNSVSRPDRTFQVVAELFVRHDQQVPRLLMRVWYSNLREVILERECETAPGKDPRSNAAFLSTYGHNRPANRQLQSMLLDQGSI